MKNVEYKEPDKTGQEENTGLRYRKTGGSFTSEMVGSGTSEFIGKDTILDRRMELEMDSEDEENDAEDTSRLIPSSVPRVSIEPINNSTNNNNKISKLNVRPDSDDDENVWTISVQMFIPFLLAGFGMVAASLLLDVVQVHISIIIQS